MLARMGASKDTADARCEAFREELEGLWPLAKGSLCEARKPCNRPGCKACTSGRKHHAYLFTFHKDGRFLCRHVRPEHVAELRKALDNGRELERLLVGQGEELLRELRGRG